MKRRSGFLPRPSTRVELRNVEAGTTGGAAAWHAAAVSDTTANTPVHHPTPALRAPCLMPPLARELRKSAARSHVNSSRTQQGLRAAPARGGLVDRGHGKPLDPVELGAR